MANAEHISEWRENGPKFESESLPYPRHGERGSIFGITPNCGSALEHACANCGVVPSLFASNEEFAL